MGQNLSSWFRGIKGKLFVASIMPVIGLALVYIIAYQGFVRISDLLEKSHKNLIPNMQALGQMRETRNRFNYQIWAAMDNSAPQLKEERIKEARNAAMAYEKAMDFYESVPFTPEMEKVYAPAQEVKKEYLEILNKALRLVESGKPEDLQAAKELLNGRQLEIGKIMGKMSQTSIEYYDNEAKSDSEEATADIKQTKNLMMLITILCTLAVIGFLMWLASKISSLVGSIAEKLTTSNQQVAQSVEQLNAAGNTLSQSSTEAAASLEETVASLEEMSSMVQMNSDNAKQAATLSISSREAAENGEQEIQHLIRSMNQISESSKKIEEIISVIDDIAFQTNLLALNAAVEAARAGEQGKGFAVVAEAVRALAQRSAVAAKDITLLIKESVSQIAEGSQIADKSGSVLNNIVNSVKKVSDLNNEIAAASSEQTAGIQQISKAMNQLDQSAQSNAASAEEIAASSGEINKLATLSQDLTQELNSVILGTTATSKPVEVASEILKKSSSPSRLQKPKSNFKKVESKNTIPFDEDERSRLGNTSEF